jgi:aminoglycoside 6-adenylyltransferase
MHMLFHGADDPVIGDLIQWAEGLPAIRAMLLTSTRAVPDANVDALSDYDVNLVVDDIQPFHANRTWLHAFGEVVVGYWDPIQPDPDFDIACFGNVIQFTSGLKIDFTLWPAEMLARITRAAALPAELDAGYRVLLDKDNLTRDLQPPTHQAYVIKRPDESAFQKCIEDFYSNAPYVAKCLLRGELLPMKWALDDDMKRLFLRQMLEWRMAMDHGWTITAGANGKGLKKRLPSALWAQLEDTYAGAGIAENWIALDRTMALFRQVATEVAAHLGYAFPHDLHARVVAHVDKMRFTQSGLYVKNWLD